MCVNLWLVLKDGIEFKDEHNIVGNSFWESKGDHDIDAKE